MSAVSATLAGRAAAEQLMIDACEVRHPGTPSVDPDTGVVTPTYTTVYSGRCKVQQRGPAANPSLVAEADVYVGAVELHVPVSVTTIRPGDLVTITACQLDETLIGQTFTTRGPVHKSFLTARRYPLVEASS